VKIKAYFEIIVDDKTPVSVPDNQEIPIIFVDEDKPEIRILTLNSTYENEDTSFSAVTPIINEEGRTILGIRDMTYALGIATKAIIWDNETRIITCK